MLTFLNALTLYYLDTSYRWSISRVSFIMRDRDRDNAKVYEARVEGLLRSKQGGRALVIIEVKLFLHSSFVNAIRTQEAAQMAA